MLIVTSAGLDNGSTRYRAINLGRSLDTMDVGSTLLHAATDIGEFEILLAAASAIVFQRCFREQGNVGAMLDLAKSLGTRCVMEMDDLVFSEFVPVIGSVAGAVERR